MSLPLELQEYARHEKVDPYTLASRVKKERKQKAKERRQWFKDRFKPLWLRESATVKVFERIEGVDPYLVLNDVKKHSKESIYERKQHRRELLKNSGKNFVHAVETVSEKAVNAYFNRLTNIRRLTGMRVVGLFDWEKAALKDLNVTDVEKPNTWRELRSSRELYVKFLQDKYVVPERLFHRLAEQATTKENRKSWMDFDQDIKKNLDKFITKLYVESISTGFSKAFLSLTPQNSDIAMDLLSESALTGYIASNINTEGSINNIIQRMGHEFALLLKVHYLTHRRPLTKFRKLSVTQVDDFSMRIFTGSRYAFEDKVVKAKAKAVAAGLGIAQTARVFSADSITQFISNVAEVGVAAGAGIYLHRKIRKENSGESVEKYTHSHEAYLETIAEVNKDIVSQYGKGASLDLFATDIPQQRDTMAEEIHSSTTKTRTVSDLMPLGATAGITALNNALPFDGFSPVNSLVTAGILVSALSPLNEEFTRARNTEVRAREIGVLEEFIDAIDQSDHHVPTYIESQAVLKEQGLPEITTRKEAFQKMYRKPLIINHLDLGSPSRKMNVKHPIIIMPGTVSFINAPKGTGKNELARMLTMEQGNIANIEVTKGLDLRQLDPKLNVLYVSEFASSSVEKTMAEQIAALVRSPHSNFFKNELAKMRERNYQLEIYRYMLGYSPDVMTSTLSNQILIGALAFEKSINRIVDILDSADDPRKEFLVDTWVRNPSSGWGTIPDESDSTVAGAVLTVSFRNFLSRLYNNVRTPEQAAAYAARIPSPSQGTSTGEASLWNTSMALAEQRQLIILDEPTAHIGGKQTHDATEGKSFDDTYLRVSDLIKEYLTICSDAVILVIEHNGVLKDDFLNRQMFASNTGVRSLVDRMIVPAAESTEDHILWESKPIQVWNRFKRR